VTVGNKTSEARTLAELKLKNLSLLPWTYWITLGQSTAGLQGSNWAVTGFLPGESRV